jgi:RNase P/RNase MRP subunit p30
VMNIGYNNKRENYEMDGKSLDEIDEEKDLSVIMQSDPKLNRRCTKAVKTANRVLGMIRRSFSCLIKYRYGIVFI